MQKCHQRKLFLERNLACYIEKARFLWKTRKLHNIGLMAYFQTSNLCKDCTSWTRSIRRRPNKCTAKTPKCCNWRLWNQREKNQRWQRQCVVYAGCETWFEESDNFSDLSKWGKLAWVKRPVLGNFSWGDEELNIIKSCSFCISGRYNATKPRPGTAWKFIRAQGLMTRLTHAGEMTSETKFMALLWFFLLERFEKFVAKKVSICDRFKRAEAETKMFMINANETVV